MIYPYWLDRKSEPMQYTEEQMNEMIKEYEPIIGSVIKRKNLYKLDDYDELMQVGRIGMWKAFANYDPEKNDNIRTFLWMAVWRSFADAYYRSHKTIERHGDTVSFQVFTDDDTHDDTKNQLFAELQTPAEDVSRHWAFEKVVSAIQHYPDQESADMALRYYLGEQSWAEIARDYGCTRANPPVRVARLITSIRKQLIHDHIFTPDELNMA